MWGASGGNPLYLAELLRGARLQDRPLAELDPAELVAGGREGVARRVLAGVRGLDRGALSLAQALAVLGDGCQLRHAAAIAGVEVSEAISLVAALVRLEVLASDDPPRFLTVLYWLVTYLSVVDVPVGHGGHDEALGGWAQIDQSRDDGGEQHGGQQDEGQEQPAPGRERGSLTR